MTFDTKIHDVVTTNSAIINYNVPGPKGDSIPFFDFEPLKKAKQYENVYFVVISLTVKHYLVKVNF